MDKSYLLSVILPLISVTLAITFFFLWRRKKENVHIANWSIAYQPRDGKDRVVDVQPERADARRYVVLAYLIFGIDDVGWSLGGWNIVNVSFVWIAVHRIRLFCNRFRGSASLADFR